MSANTRSRIGVLRPRFLRCLATVRSSDDRASRKKEKARPARNAPETDLKSPYLGIGRSSVIMQINPAVVMFPPERERYWFCSFVQRTNLIERHARSLRRRRHSVTLAGTPRTPERAGGDQPARRANVRPADCLRQHLQGATYSKIAAAMACRVTRWADRSKSRSGQGRARPALCLNFCLSDQRCS